MARLQFAWREGVWDMAIEQFAAPHHGAHYSTVFSCMIHYVINGKIQISV